MSPNGRETTMGVETTRAYRSRKRHRPCDRCREMKLKCLTDDQPPCKRCQQSKTECTFVGRPSKRPLSQRSSQQKRTRNTSSLPPAEEHAYGIALEESYPVESSPFQPTTTAPETVQSQSTPFGGFSHGLEVSPLTSVQLDRPTTQLSQSLDQMEGHSAMLLGSSSGSDPWLLRHFRFDELGLRSFHMMHIRNAGGLPTADKIPVHFLLTSDALSANQTPSKSLQMRQELDGLVSQSMGIRLIRLFHKHVFSLLPVISRTALGLTSQDLIPDPGVLTTMPTHLLAAVYGSSLPFILHDDQLAAPSAYDDVPLDKIWDIVDRSMHEDAHKPHLSLLQAALLYLHKTHTDQRKYAATDTSSLWPFMGTVVGLAHNLGLHLECRMMGLPAHEKRLRRRLWWAVYIEDKFLSLLTGRPPYIRQDEWDVIELDELDFAPYGEPGTSSTKTKSPFRDMGRLALIAETLQADLFSLRSCQKLAENLPGSIQAARPIFDALHTWRATVPVREPYHSKPGVGFESSESYPACVHLAYLTLVAYTWRALLRPAVRSPPPPQIIDVENEPQVFPDTGFLFENLSWDFSDLPEIELQLEDGVTDASATIKELHQAAQSWAESLVQFTSNLSSGDLGGMWYSWSKFSFVVASNLLLLLLVQAPSEESGIRAKAMLEHWRQVVRDQSRASPLFILSFTDLSQIYGVGLAETFCVPLHVQGIL